MHIQFFTYTPRVIQRRSFNVASAYKVCQYITKSEKKANANNAGIFLGSKNNIGALRTNAKKIIDGIKAINKNDGLKMACKIINSTIPNAKNGVTISQISNSKNKTGFLSKVNDNA